MKFHNFPAIVKTSLTFACLQSTGQCSHGNDIFIAYKLIVIPGASIVVFQSVVFLGARIGVTRSFPFPNNRT